MTVVVSSLSMKLLPMIDTILGVALGFAFLIGVPFLLLSLRDRVFGAGRKRRDRSVRLEAERNTYQERILRPDWAFYEEHLQRSVPQALLDLYADRILVVSGGFECSKDLWISTFDALDEQGLRDSRDQLGFDAVAIATTGYGDPIYLRPGAAEPDIVYITWHDGGDTEAIAPDVATFVQRLREGFAGKRQA